MFILPFSSLSSTRLRIVSMLSASSSADISTVPTGAWKVILSFVLGPRGKMPKPIAPGVDPTAMIDGLRRTVSVRTKDRMTFHAPVGTVEMSAEELADNIETILKRVELKLEKGRMNIASSYIKTTMGPSERLI